MEDPPPTVTLYWCERCKTVQFNRTEHWHPETFTMCAGAMHKCKYYYAGNPRTNEQWKDNAQ